MSQVYFVFRMEIGWGESLVVGVGFFQGSVLSSERVYFVNAVFSFIGMCLQVFVEVFFYLVQKKFKMLSFYEQVVSLIDLCEYYLFLLDEKRLVCGYGGISGGRFVCGGIFQEVVFSVQSVEGNFLFCVDSVYKFFYFRYVLF